MYQELLKDLFSFYILFSQYRSCDNTLENCFFHISSNSPAYVHRIYEKTKGQQNIQAKTSIAWSVHEQAISLVICVPLPGKHISLVICVSLPGKHISPVKCVPLPGKHISLVIFVPLPGKHINLVICLPLPRKHKFVVICGPLPRKHNP